MEEWLPVSLLPVGDRRLGADSAEATLSAWRAAALTAIVALALVVAAGAIVFVWQSRRSSSPVGDRPEGSKPLGSTQKVTDPELGEGSTKSEDCRSTRTPSPVNSELRDALRELLKEELSRGIYKCGGLSERLERLEGREDLDSNSDMKSNRDRLESLEKQFCGHGETLRCAAGCDGTEIPLPPGRIPEGGLRSAAGRPTCFDDSEPLQPPPPPFGAPPPLGRKPSFNDAGMVTDREPLKDYGQMPIRRRRSGLSVVGAFGPTKRQCLASEPPEKATFQGDDGASYRLSIATLQKQLQRREVQAQELHRQIRDCQQALRQQTLTHKNVRRRLKELLNDQSTASRLQVEELTDLRRTKDTTGKRLTETRNAELHWATMAKRHRAFFLQTERLVSEGVESRRGVMVQQHPAGEIFLAPPPVTVDGDEEDVRKTPWDVGTSIMNPYITDSWPFEPNVLAQRLAFDTSLTRLEEEDHDLVAAELAEEEYEDEFEQDQEAKSDDVDSEQAQLDALLKSNEDALGDYDRDEDGEFGEDIIGQHLASVGCPAMLPVSPGAGA
eukprot:TRINITY_DN29943_c0_g2_i1.p1 TRINITY_DN29943_c0_g2~~TRINITY_DN29943_c0_g2_i1.p1  ORF type:complete len:586 (-),score=120.71 TRINITY_DN29943_c0_g2_i1:182-1846(-)